MMLCGSLRDRIQPWLRDYVKLQSLAVFLIYIQIGCALIGSLGALYNGVLLINLAIALFALVAIESNSQSLGRTYAVLLFCALLLDISWFILFTEEIWSISAETNGTFFIFSVKLTMAMEMIGFSVRLSSSLLWFQMYRLGASIVDTSSLPSDLRNSFLNPPTPAAIDRQCSGAAEEILGGSIYDPAYYTSLFEEAQSNLSSPKVNHYSAENNGSPSAAEASRIMSPGSRSLHAIDEEKGLNQQGMSSSSL
ncbi:Transmembrane protein [Hirschfeldia incana]|nr:Transmembrane protein [Hirschfeldia incana]